VALLGWVFHSIFMKEGRTAAERQGMSWNQLSRGEQWKIGWHHGPKELWGNVSLIAPGTFVASVLVMGVTLILGIWRWRMVLAVHGLNLPWGRATEISFVAHFFNSFLLGSTGGDLMKALYAARETHHKKTEAVVTVLADRLIGLWAMLLFAGLMIIPNTSLVLRHERLRALAFLVLGMLAGCSLVAILAFRGGLSRKWTGAREWLRGLPKGEWLERLLEAARDFGRQRWFIRRTTAVSMILNAVCVLQVWILSSGLNLNVPLIALFAIVPMIICISALPITPAGLGLRENLYVLVLADPVMSVDPTAALSLSLLAYAGFLFWSIVGGVVYLLYKDKHHLTEQELAQRVEVAVPDS
jgi:uncharacterized protein (TIRG00374 family)